jgi:exodeoxyribonuclease V alpha subunit
MAEIQLPIRVEKVIFRNDRGWAILGSTLNPYSSKYTSELEELLAKSIRPNKYNNFSVTIDLVDPHEKVEGGQYICTGEFFKHPKFGEQFKASYMFIDIPTSDDGLRDYLQTLPNIKSSRSKAIIKKWGCAETIRILDNEVEKLLEINGITENRLPPIKQAWDRNKGLMNLYIWLIDHKIQPKIGKDIFARWKMDSLKVISENPYKLTELPSFGFLKADEIAYKILKEVPKSLRVISCMQYVLDEDIRSNSNLYMPISVFRDTVINILKDGDNKHDPLAVFDENEYRNLIGETLKRNLNIFVAVRNLHKKDINGRNDIYIYKADVWKKEKFIANAIYSRCSEGLTEENTRCTDKDIDDAEKDVSRFSGREIKLDDCQKNAVRAAFDNKISVITGGGGSGKSSICRCICHLAQEKGLSLRLMSPTGKASRVLSNKTGHTAGTIHRSLKMRPGDDNPKETIMEDIIIIDEVSMVGLDTMFAIMKATERNLWGHIIFVGDPQQLPSVAPGNFLSDIINSDCVKVVKLEKIYRQDENSYIALLANDISRGKIVEIPEKASDIKWHELTSYSTWAEKLTEIVKDFIYENDIDDLQILAPMYRGTYGIDKTNEVVQELMADINGSKDDKSLVLTRSFTKYYVGDRVLQTENNTEKDIFNGDMGKVTQVGRKATNANSDEMKDFVVVNFFGRDIMFESEEIDKLKLAWCVSVHKFQGSQSPYIMFLFSNESEIMASREILYTGMTRAEKQLDIYGHTKMFKLAPKISVIKTRFTNMNNMIIELKKNMKILAVYGEK